MRLMGREIWQLPLLKERLSTAPYIFSVCVRERERESVCARAHATQTDSM